MLYIPMTDLYYSWKFNFGPPLLIPPTRIPTPPPYCPTSGQSVLCMCELSFVGFLFLLWNPRVSEITQYLPFPV